MRAPTPSDREALVPRIGGALYAPASHGWTASFHRPVSPRRVPGLLLAAGSIHPGSDVPMALSRQLVAASLMADCASTRRFDPAAMPGGTSTR